MTCKVVCLVLLVPVLVCSEDLGSSCTTPNGEQATCILLTSCRVIRDAMFLRNASAIKFGKMSQCGYEDGPLVCCGSTGYFVANDVDQVPDVELSPLLPIRSECGLEIDVDKIYGGQITQLGEFPWMALMRYDYDDGTDAGYKCAGTLINNRYVLTVAHCLVIPSGEFGVVTVRLGEWRLSTDEDCKDDTFAIKQCSDPVVDVRVERTIPHPEYNHSNAKNDIGLVRLERNVEFTKYIRPICLPIPNSAAPPDGHILTVAGWGATETDSASDYKLKVQVPIVGLATCKTKLPGRPIDDQQICAGGAKSKDSCHSDSGGPLMGSFDIGTKKHWYQEGLVSWGRGCGVESFPGVYTKVSKYMDWIIPNLSA